LAVTASPNGGGHYTTIRAASQSIANGGTAAEKSKAVSSYRNPKFGVAMLL
jgi:hypothetical protein